MHTRNIEVLHLFLIFRKIIPRFDVRIINNSNFSKNNFSNEKNIRVKKIYEERERERFIPFERRKSMSPFVKILRTR